MPSAAARPPMSGAKQQELVAAEPGEDVLRHDVRAQAFGDGAQQPVAAGVAQRVVDQLEAIEVQHQHGNRPLLVLRIDQRALDMAVEEIAVREASQPVVVRHAPDRLGRAARLGEVVHLDQRVGVAARLAHRRERQLDVEGVAAGAVQLELVLARHRI